MNKGGMNMKT